MSIWEAVGVASAPATSRRDGAVGSDGLAPLVMIARLKAILRWSTATLCSAAAEAS